jgi:hypothetical protein
MQRILVIFGSTIGAVAIACGHSGTSSHTDAPPLGVDAATDARPIDAPPGTFMLTVKNYSSWCSVQVGSNGTFTTTTPQMEFVAPSTVQLIAKRASATFELGSDMWHYVDGTTGDTGVSGTHTGSGIAATSEASVTVSNANKCVWVCCPFAGTGSGCDPASIGDQCP